MMFAGELQKLLEKSKYLADPAGCCVGFACARGHAKLAGTLDEFHNFLRSSNGSPNKDKIIKRISTYQNPQNNITYCEDQPNLIQWQVEQVSSYCVSETDELTQLTQLFAFPFYGTKEEVALLFEALGKFDTENEDTFNLIHISNHAYSITSEDDKPLFIDINGLSSEDGNASYFLDKPASPLKKTNCLLFEVYTSHNRNSKKYREKRKLAEDALSKFTELKPTALTDESESQLYFAALSGNVELVKELVDAIPSELKAKMINSNMRDIHSPFNAACQSGNLDTAIVLLENGGDPNSKCPELNRTPLHQAVTLGHAEIASYLLEHGAEESIDARDLNSATPLYLAAVQGKASCVELLLSHGADPSLTSGGYSPIHAAVALDHAQTIAVFFQHHLMFQYMFHAAVMTKDVKVLNFLLAHPIKVLDPNEKPQNTEVFIDISGLAIDIKGDSALKVACRYGKVEHVKKFLLHEVHHQLKSPKLVDLLCVAATGFKHETLDILLSDKKFIEAINCVDTRGIPALASAFATKSFESVHLFLRRGANPIKYYLDRIFAWVGEHGAKSLDLGDGDALTSLLIKHQNALRKYLVKLSRKKEANTDLSEVLEAIDKKGTVMHSIFATSNSKQAPGMWGHDPGSRTRRILLKASTKLKARLNEMHLRSTRTYGMGMKNRTG